MNNCYYVYMLTKEFIKKYKVELLVIGIPILFMFMYPKVFAFIIITLGAFMILGCKKSCNKCESKDKIL